MSSVCCQVSTGHRRLGRGRCPWDDSIITGGCPRLRYRRVVRRLVQSPRPLRSPTPEHALEGIPERRGQKKQQHPDPTQCYPDLTEPKAGTDIRVRGLCEGQRQPHASAVQNQREKRPRPFENGFRPMPTRHHGTSFGNLTTRIIIGPPQPPRPSRVAPPCRPDPPLICQE